MDSIQIQLSRGLVARVSESDAGLVLPYKWHAVAARHTHYAARRVGTKTIYLHRVVMGLVDAPRSVFVDHINRNGLDNTRQNLRVSDAKANAQNRRYLSDYLGLRGVRPAGDKWHAQIRVAGQLVFLGAFDTQREAGIAYASACRVIGREAA